MYCYQASEALYHLLGGKEAGLTPMHTYHKEGDTIWSHWYLRWEVGDKTFYLDPTSTQFTTAVPYEKGRGCGFRTKSPSKQTKELMQWTGQNDSTNS